MRFSQRKQRPGIDGTTFTSHGSQETPQQSDFIGELNDVAHRDPMELAQKREARRVAARWPASC
jgi:hypothetical protein